MNCKTCKHGIWDSVWTEYKCKKKGERLRNCPTRCMDYEKGTPVESKNGGEKDE